MKFIVYGVGAIGGGIAASLALSGQEIVGIARGAQLAAIKANGLVLRTPDGDQTANFPCVGDPADLNFDADDVILLTMKTQDTAPALERLRAGGVTDQAVVCAQNGVANERLALRFFPNVYGLTLMMPATYVTVGEILAFGVPHIGIFDIGRFPSGSDGRVDHMVERFTKARFAAFGHPNVMENKYAKLLLNLGNIFDAALGEAARQNKYAEAAHAEGLAVYRAAGIKAGNLESDDRRNKLVQMRPIPGAERVGSSSSQSLKRGAGSIETDYLNGEIVLLGRLHGVPTPINAWLCALAQRLVHENLGPGTISMAEIAAALDPILGT